MGGKIKVSFAEISEGDKSNHHLPLSEWIRVKHKCPDFLKFSDWIKLRVDGITESANQKMAAKIKESGYAGLKLEAKWSDENLRFHIEFKVQIVDSPKALLLREKFRTFHGDSGYLREDNFALKVRYGIYYDRLKSALSLNTLVGNWLCNGHMPIECPGVSFSLHDPCDDGEKLCHTASVSPHCHEMKNAIFRSYYYVTKAYKGGSDMNIEKLLEVLVG